VQLALLELQERRVFRASRVTQEILGHKVSKVFKVSKVSKVSRVTQEILDRLVQLVLLVLLDHKV
jgi:hypothetical protein